MGVIQDEAGRLVTDQTGTGASADSVQVPSADAVVFQVAETNGGTGTVKVDQQLPTATQWAEVGTAALTGNDSAIIVVTSPVGKLRSRVSAVGGSPKIQVWWAGHFPR